MTRLIAYIPTPGGLTGGPRRLLTLASVLKECGIEVCIASQSGSELLGTAKSEGHEAATVDAPGVLALRKGALFGRGPWFRLRVFVDLLIQNWRLLRCIQQRRGDAVRIVGSKGIAFGALAVVLSGRPLVLDLFLEPPSRGVVRLLHRLGLWAASAVMFEYTAAPDAMFGQELATRYRHKCRMIIPGIELSTLESFRTMRKRRTKSEDDTFVVLQVGTLCDRKNQMVLIEAVAQVLQARPGQTLRVWLAGGGVDEVYAETLRREVEAEGLKDVVEFLGWRSDVHELMANADLLTMPSKDEGVANTVQEAMAIGLPTAISNAGGMPEVVMDGETGWVLPINRVADWTERIQWCLEHPEECEAVGDCGSAYAFEHFGMEHWGTEYGRVVNEVVRSGSVMRTGVGITDE